MKKSRAEIEAERMGREAVEALSLAIMTEATISIPGNPNGRREVRIGDVTYVVTTDPPPLEPKR